MGRNISEGSQLRKEGSGEAGSLLYDAKGIMEETKDKTNAIERAFREVRRRTRTMSCFNNTESIERIVFAVMSRLNENWMDTPVYEFTENY